LSTAQQLIADQLQVFLGPDSPAVQITRFPAGSNDGEPVTAIVDWEREATGSRANPGAREARTFDSHGRRAECFCILELAATQDVGDGDRFAVEDCGKTVLVNFIRRTGSDEVLQTILCEAPGSITTKSTRLRS
jgi:hypothetical protein